MDYSSQSAEWVLDPIAVQDFLQQFHLQNNVIDFVCEASRRISASNNKTDFLHFCGTWQQRLNDPQTIALPAEWKALAVISSFPKVIAQHRARGISWDITRATLADFERDARGDYLTGAPWKFTRLNWMNNHISGTLFELGRLQFVIGSFHFPYRIYRNITNGEPVAFALPQLKCTEEGWFSEDATGFITQLDIRQNGIYGNAASPHNGAISGELQCLAPQSPLLLNDASTVLHVHIPSGGKLDIGDCIASLKMAQEFFATYFPEKPIDAFCTATWLLDRELEKVLSSDSNIVKFAQLFHPLARPNADDAQLLERVFGKDITWENCVAQTSLQKAVLQHHQNGGTFRITAGYILPEEITRL